MSASFQSNSTVLFHFEGITSYILLFFQAYYTHFVPSYRYVCFFVFSHMIFIYNSYWSICNKVHIILKQYFLPLPMSTWVCALVHSIVKKHLQRFQWITVRHTQVMLCVKWDLRKLRNTSQERNSTHHFKRIWHLWEMSHHFKRIWHFWEMSWSASWRSSQNYLSLSHFSGRSQISRRSWTAHVLFKR